jgi:hypothetical protein
MVDACLALRIRLGSDVRVSRVVAEAHGWEIPAEKIGKWRRISYPNRYASLFAEHLPVAQAQMIRNASDEVVALAGTSESIREKLEDELDQLKPSELSGALKNIAIAQGVQTDKMLLLSGQPTVRSEMVTSEDVLRNLEARGFAKRRVIEDSIEAHEVQPGAQ